MRPSTLKALTAAFAALLLLWGINALARRSRPRTNPLWPEAAQAGRLDVIRPGQPATVAARGEGGWSLKEPFEFAADGPAIERILEQLSKAELSEPIASGRESHARYRVTDSSGIRLRGYLATKPEPALDLIIGKTGAGFDTFLARRPGSAEVIEARGIGRFEFDRPAGEWADRLVCAIEESRIKEIELRRLGSQYTLAQADGKWVVGGGRRPATAALMEKLQPVLTALTRLEADSVLPVKDAHPFVLRGLENPELDLRVRTVEGSTVEFAVGPKKPGYDHPLRRKGLEKAIYELKGWRVEAFYELAKSLAIGTR